ncbi:transposase, partial [Arenibacter sp. H213]|nr:transposase [Arenibacter sp. H213]
MDIELVRYLLPEGVLDYFEIVGHKSSEGKIHFYLEEKNV